MFMGQPKKTFKASTCIEEKETISRVHVDLTLLVFSHSLVLSVSCYCVYFISCYCVYFGFIEGTESIENMCACLQYVARTKYQVIVTMVSLYSFSSYFLVRAISHCIFSLYLDSIASIHCNFSIRFSQCSI